MLRLRVVLFASMALVLTASVAAAKRPGWADADHDCQNTRQEVLISSCAQTVLDAKGCHVIMAVCLDQYSGQTIATATPAHDIQIDHLLPQSVVRARWQGGEAEFLAFYNDPENLVPTSAAGNERKSDLMPDQWCPRAREARPVMASRILSVVKRHRITLTASESAAVQLWRGGLCAEHARMIP